MIGVRGEALAAGEDDVADTGREARDVGVRGEELLGVEGVPAAPPGQRPPHLGADRPIEDRARQFGDAGLVERNELDPLRPCGVLEIRQEGQQRMASVQLVAAVGRDQHDPLQATSPRQFGHQLPGGAVSPVEVLDRDHQRAGRRNVGQQRSNLGMQPGRRLGQRGRPVGGPVGQQRRQVRIPVDRGGGDDRNEVGQQVSDRAQGTDFAAVLDAATADGHAAAMIPTTPPLISSCGPSRQRRHHSR